MEADWRETPGYHSGAAEDASLLGCDVVCFETFRRIVVSSRSGFKGKALCSFETSENIKPATQSHPKVHYRGQWSQQPATCTYPEPDKSIPPTPRCLRSIPGRSFQNVSFLTTQPQLPHSGCSFSSLQPNAFCAACNIQCRCWLCLYVLGCSCPEVDTSLRSKDDSSLKLTTYFLLMVALKYYKLHTCIHASSAALRHRNNCMY